MLDILPECSLVVFSWKSVQQSVQYGLIKSTKPIVSWNNATDLVIAQLAHFA